MRYVSGIFLILYILGHDLIKTMSMYYNIFDLVWLEWFVNSGRVGVLTDPSQFQLA